MLASARETRYPRLISPTSRTARSAEARRSPPVLAQEAPQISGTVNLDTVGGGGGVVRVEERHSFDNIGWCGWFPVDAEGRFSGEFSCTRRPDPLIFTYIDAGGAEIPLTAGRAVLATDPLEGLALTRGPAVERPESGHGVGQRRRLVHCERETTGGTVARAIIFDREHDAI